MERGDVVSDRFELLDEVGSGGMGTVWRATDRVSGDSVAIKVLRAGARESERFTREAQVLATLQHPGIVRYVTHGVTPRGDAFLAMEWLEGEDLHQRMSRGELGIDAAVTLVRIAADALGAAHRRGVVHRDVKPGNLFLVGGATDQVRVVDFGIARIANAAGPATQSGVVIGTPGYMSPEQARGESAVDARADVFALGCVLYECLTGRAAFVGEHVLALLAKILLEEAPRASDLRPEVPPALDDLVARMLAKDPKLRPGDGSEVAAALASIPSVAEPHQRRTSTRPAALTTSEQRVLSVVMAAVDPVTRPDATDAPTVLVTRDETLDKLRDAVGAQGGRVERIADGSLVITVNDVGVATDQAARAARCALILRKQLVAVPVALATGRGQVAGRLPVGEVIDRAVRVLRTAKRPAPAEGDTLRSVPVLIDDVTAGLLDARFDVRGDAYGLLLRGEREVLEATRTLMGRPTSCVGREQELAMLDATLSQCADDSSARVVLVTAAAGAGKSRVRYEFLRRARQAYPAMDPWIARGDPMSAGSPFGLIGPAVRRAAGILDGEPASVRQQKLRARVGRHVPVADVQRVSEFLGELAAVPFAEETSVQLQAARRDAMLMGDQMRRAWEDFLFAESRVQPVLIVLEDLHWGDLPSVRFIDSALRNLANRPLMVVALARPEVHEVFPRLWAERDVSEVRLRGLSRKASERLVHEVLGNTVPAETVALLIDRANGNALYLEELIRAAREGRGHVMPESVLAMVQARLERLEPEARRVLRGASVFGQAFWRGGVEALLGGLNRNTMLMQWLKELIESEVVAARGEGKFPGEDEFVFRHALVREAAYASLTEQDRTLGHRLAGAWLLDHGERDPLVLAEHFERGGEPQKALSHYHRAAEQALEGNDYDGAIARVERGIACGASGEALGALRLVEAEARRWRGAFADAERAAREAMRQLPACSDGWYRAAAELASAAGATANTQALEALAADLLHGTSDEVNSAWVIAAAHTVVQLNHLGRYAMAQAGVDWMRTVGANVSARDPAVAGWIGRARGMRAASDVNPGALLDAATTSVRDFLAAGDLRMACFQRMNLGYASIVLGRYGAAERELEEARSTATRLGVVQIAASCLSYLGFARAQRGEYQEGIALLRNAVTTMRGMTENRMLGRAMLYLARALLASGDVAEAERTAAAAIETCEAIPATRTLARIVWGHVVLARGRPDDALAAARDGMKALERFGSVEDGEVLLRLTYAESLRATGDENGARDAIALARRSLLARAQNVIDPTARESFLRDVAENARTLDLATRWDAPA